MLRRVFLRNTVLTAVAVGTSGYVCFDGVRYVGDCETTTDILGPFYRPGSPERTSLVKEGDKGTRVLLKGKILHNDCKTPYNKARVEIWHCDADGVYDNLSDEFRFRGTTHTDKAGNYHFNTVLPVPYDVGNGRKRPAHFHLMITAEGYQPFVTQLYFAGDEFISRDASSSSPAAKRRILNVQSLSNGSKQVTYDIAMSPKLSAEPEAINRLTGIYKDEQTQSEMEFFNHDNLLWLKNEVYGVALDYMGSNSFYTGELSVQKTIFNFELLAGGAIKVTRTTSRDSENGVLIAMKA